ncbi:MAG: DUF2510 domain-containing protein [Pseudolysinimonas sp.]
MTDTIAPAAPAGWYDDPSDVSAYRWWSGADWTTYTSPKPAPVVAPQPQTFASAYVPMSRDPAVQHPGEFAQTLATLPVPSAMTPGVWLLAFLPFMTLGLSGISTMAFLASGVPALSFVGVPFGIGLAWLFAVLDVRALRRRGYVPPSLLWMLLFPPLGYLIARGRYIRKQGGKAWPPEVAYVGSIVIVGAVALTLSALSALSAANTPAQIDDNYFYAGTFGESGPVSQSDMEDLLTNALMPDGSFPADCSTALIDRGGSFVCEANDTVTTAQLLLYVDFCDCGDVYFSVERVDGQGPAPEAATPGLHGTGNGLILDQERSAGSIGDEQQQWLPQIQQSLEISGGYANVDCWDAAAFIDHASTFDCYAAKPDDTLVRLNVSITEIGNIGYTEFPYFDGTDDDGQNA